MKSSPTVFLSYTREDQATARLFADTLEAHGFTVWWDTALHAGEFFDQTIERTLNEAKAVVVLWSKRSVNSRWVRAEATIGDRNRTLVPVMIEACQRPIMFELTHTAELSHWRGDIRDPAWRTFVADVRRLVEDGVAREAASGRAGDPLPAAARTPWYRGRNALICLVVLAVLLTVTAFVAMLRSPTSPTHSVAGGAAASGAGSAQVSREAVAVLPFANLTGDPGKDYLGEGMAEEVINLLTKVPGLQVPARTSSFAYKDRNIDIRQIARDLNVGSVLEGSVRSAGDRIRITAELISANSGLHIWSQSYDARFTDLFRLEDDLAGAIVGALEANLKGSTPAPVSQAPPTQDVEAYNLYLQGYSLMLRGSEEGLRLALGLFGQSLSRDPTFARALAARSRLRLTFLVRGYPLANARDDAADDAQKALALDPHLDVAHQALGNVSALRANWLQAESSYRAALAAASTDPDIHSGYAMVLLAPTGRLHQARLEGAAAYRLAPASARHVGIVAQLALLTGDDSAAVKFADLAVALGLPGKGNALPEVYALTALRGRHFEMAADRAAQAISPEVRRLGGAAVIRLVYAALGDPAKNAAARQALEELTRKLPAGEAESQSRRDFIMDFTLLGAMDSAYALADPYLDEFLRTGIGGGVEWGFLWLPEMRPFRTDPRFQAFAERLNLIRFWTEYGAPDDCSLSAGQLRCH
ncbi:MAG TPA: TIR domain-containing protein [Steroidobacteraceae bacterium]|nr:TIR domain-containing protein [Steroidobacteraceae bacterium]